jgi:hypothetical protein
MAKRKSTKGLIFDIRILIAPLVSSNSSSYVRSLSVQYLNDLSYFVNIMCCILWGNQNPYIEDEQTTQWPKEKVQKDKQRSTKHTYNTK